jgi:CheY-like chemotaxis protein
MTHNILVVDDNALNADLARIILTRAGFSVKIARDGYQALQAIKALPFHLALIDINMPGMSGRDLCVLIRASEHAPRIRLVAYTAMAMPSERDSLRGVGFDDIVIKPAARSVLLEAVNAQLSELGSA